MARIALVHDVAGVAAVQAGLLRSAGHDVDLIELPDTGARWRWPVKALALPFRVAAYLPAVNRLRKGDYDVVHIHWIANGIVGLMAGRGFFAQAHGSDLHVNFNNPLYRAVSRSVLKKARKVFYVTPNLRSYLHEVDAKAVYLPNPVDMRGIGAPFPAPTQVSKVLIFTRLHPVKGVDRIFPAVESLVRTVDVTALDWGPLARDYMKRYGDKVHFVQPMPHPDVGTFLSGFDVVIGQMHQGILSLMEIEALATGRPVITAIDWSLYPTDPPPVTAASNAVEIAQAVEDLRKHPDRLAEISRLGREWALRNHSYSHHLQLLESAYFGSAQHAAPRESVSAGQAERQDL
ncbi:MAG TPA: glycosyltransferase family 4 protein [Candidatus Dormibacteraeota bacterium]